MKQILDFLMWDGSIWVVAFILSVLLAGIWFVISRTTYGPDRSRATKQASRQTPPANQRYQRIRYSDGRFVDRATAETCIGEAEAQEQQYK